MQVFDKKEQLKTFVRSLPSSSTSSLVPTMGHLHDGHLILIRRAQTTSDVVIVSIFVNPKQFNSSKDLQDYPRTLKDDLDMLEHEGVTAVFTPSPGEMYSKGFQTYVSNHELASTLCGKDRPGHFTGVCTVLIILIHLTKADFLFLGYKDMQQFKVVDQMVNDLELPIKVVGVETLRDKDGLALSSRNSNLSSSERQLALALPRTLKQGREIIRLAQQDSQQPLEVTIEALRESLNSIDGLELDYLELCSEASLESVRSSSHSPLILLGAIRVGKTRLIDNLHIRQD